MARQALDVAKYVINRCYCDGNAVSNLQLQKILYYLQGYYCAEFKQPLFDDRIEPWKLGPVVPNVYYVYNKYVADNIYQAYPEIGEILGFSEDEKKVIDEIIDSKSKLSAWELVDATHKEEPWKQAKANGDFYIDVEMIQNYFDNGR